MSSERARNAGPHRAPDRRVFASASSPLPCHHAGPPLVQPAPEVDVYQSRRRCAGVRNALTAPTPTPQATDAPAVLSSRYLAESLASSQPTTTIATGFASLLARIMDAPGARGDDARSALVCLRDATARAHFAGDSSAVAAALACYDAVVEAAGAAGAPPYGPSALPPDVAASVAIELKREALLLLSATPGTSWASHDAAHAAELRLALLKRVWTWSAAERAAAASAARPPPPPARPAALKRTASGRAPPPPSFEEVVATLGGCEGMVLLPILQLLLNETAFRGVVDDAQQAGDTPANATPAPPAPCPFAPATPPTLTFDPFGEDVVVPLAQLSVSDDATTPAKPVASIRVDVPSVPQPPSDDEPFAALSPVAPRRAPPPPPPMRAQAKA